MRLSAGLDGVLAVDAPGLPHAPPTTPSRAPSLPRDPSAPVESSAPYADAQWRGVPSNDETSLARAFVV